MSAIQDAKDAFVRQWTIFSCCLIAAATVMNSAAARDTGHPLLTAAAPDFALRAFEGENMRLSEHRGEVIVLSFWSGRCNPCRKQLEALERSLKTYQSAGLRIFGIGVEDDLLRAREFASAQAVRFPMLADPDKSVARLYGVDRLPMTVLVDRSGVVRHVHRNFDSKSEALYLRQLRTLLNE